MWRSSEWISELKADMKDLRKDISTMKLKMDKMDLNFIDVM